MASVVTCRHCGGQRAGVVRRSGALWVVRCMGCGWIWAEAAPSLGCAAASGDWGLAGQIRGPAPVNPEASGLRRARQIVAAEIRLRRRVLRRRAAAGGGPEAPEWLREQIAANVLGLADAEAIWTLRDLGRLLKGALGAAAVAP